MFDVKNKKILTYLGELDGNLDLKTQVERLYVYCSWNGQVYKQHSLKGWIVKHLQSPFHYHSSQVKAFEIFRETALHFVKVTPDFKERFPHLRVQIFDQLIKEQIMQPHVTAFNNPEIDKLQAHQKSFEAQKEEESKKTRIAKKRENSLVRLPEAEAIDIDPKCLETVFGNEFTTEPAAAFDFLEKYLKKHPEYAVPQWEEKLKAFRKGLEGEERLKQLFSPQGDALTPEERQQALRKMSVEAQATLMREGKYGLYINYGPRQLSLDGLADAMKALPKIAFNQLPSFIKDALEDEKPFNTKQVIAKLLSQIAIDLKGKLSSPKMSGFKPGELDLYFGYENRNIPNPIAALLPEVIEQQLNEYLQGGVIGAASHLLPKGASSALHWIAMNGQELIEAPDDSVLMKELEARITAILEKKLTSSLKSLNQGFTNYQQNVNTVLPPALIKALGVDGLLSSGPLWLELERQPNGLYSSNVYAAGTALLQHPLSLAKNAPYVVYRLQDISPSKLPPEFFHSLISRHVEPFWDPQAGARARDIYQGPLKSIGGTVVSNPTQDRVGEAFKPATQWQLALNIVLKNREDAASEFEIRLNALLQLCRPFLRKEDQALQFNDLQEQRQIEQALTFLENAMPTLRNRPELAQRIVEIDATFAEIREALHEAKKVESEGQATSVLNSICDPELLSKALAGVGINLERLDAWRNVLRWALGDEAGELADFIVENMRTVVPAKAEGPVVVEEEIPSDYAWGMASYISLYSTFLANLLQALFTIVATQFRDAVDTLRGPLLSYLPYILPPPLEKWITQTLETAKLLLAKIVLTAIWRLVVLTPTGKKLEKNLTLLKGKMRDLKKGLAGEMPLKLEIPETHQIASSPEKPKIEENTFELTLNPFNSINISDENNTKGILLPDPYFSEQLTAKINSDTVTPLLLRLKIGLERHSNPKNCLAAVDFIKRLEIPTLGKKSLWDDIEDPEECIQHLENLGKLLWEQSFDPISQGRRGDVVIAMYTLYAIGICLSYRCYLGKFLGSLGQGNFNAYPLAKWAAAFGTEIDDPELHQRLKDLFAYLLPDIDFNNIPTAQALDHKAERTIFHYENGKRSLAELEYLHEVAKRIDREDLFDHGYPVELDQSAIVDLLFAEGFQRASTNEMGPPHFNQLRRLSLLCFKAVAHDKTKEKIKIDATEDLSGHLNNCQHRIKNPLKRTREDPRGCESCYTAVMNENPEYINALHQTGKVKYLHLAIQSFDPPENKAEEVINCHSEKIDTDRQFWIQAADLPYRIREKELLFASKEERIGLSLNYYRHHRGDANFQKHGLPFLKNTLRSPGALEKFIQTRPGGAQQIGEFFSSLIDYYRKKQHHVTLHQVIWLGITVKNLYMGIDSNAASYLPDFSQALEEIRKDSSDQFKYIDQVYQMLLALNLKAENKDPLAITRAFCEAATGPSIPAFEKGFHMLASEFSRAFYQWLPQMEEHFYNSAFRNELLDSLLMKHHYIFDPSEKEEWVLTKELFIFKKGKLTYNIANNKIKDPKPHIHDRLTCVKSKLTGIFTPGRLEFLRENSKGEFTFNHLDDIRIQLLQDEKGQYRIQLERVIDDQTFSYLGKKNDETYWKNSLGHTATFGYFDTFIKITKDEPKVEALSPKKVRAPIALDGCQKGLEPLSRFVPLTQLVVEAEEGHKSISCIKIPAYGLNFNVVNGQAQSQEYAGFFISLIQTDPVTKGLTSYLILENVSGEKKVLVPYNQWTPAIAWRGFKQLGPIGDYLNRILNLTSLNPKQLELEAGVAVYDIQGKGTDRCLASRDPCHLAYLLSLKVLQGYNQEAEGLYRQLEWLCNSQQIPANIWNHLLPLAFLQIDLEDFAHMRRRVFAAVAQSQQIRGAPIGSKPLSQITNGIILTSILMDLRNMQTNADPRREINAKSEYFLYMCASNMVKEVISETLPPAVAKLFETLGWENIFDEIGLLPNFSTRLREIRKEAGIPGTWFPKLSQWLLRVWQAPGSLPEFLAGGQYHPVIKGAYDKEGGLAQYWLSILAYGRDTFLFDVAGLQLKALQKQVALELRVDPLLDPMELTPDLFKRDFLTYYSIARGEWPYMSSWKGGELPRDKLIKLLQLRKGGWDKQSQVLMKHLEATLAFPQIFHKTAAMQEVFSTKQKVEEYFSENNRKALYSHFCETFLLPVTKNETVVGLTQEVVTEVKQRVVSILPGGDLTQFTIKATEKLAVDHTTAAIVEKAAPTIEKKPNTTFLSKVGVDQSSFVESPHFPWAVAAGTYGLYVASVAATGLASGVATLLPTVVQTASTSQGAAALALAGVGTAAAKIAIAKVFKKPIGPRDIMPGWAIEGVRWIKKGVNAYYSLPADPVIYAKTKKEELPVNYRQLQEAEDFFNGLFETVYKHLFTDLPPSEIVGSWAPFVAKGILSKIEEIKLTQNQESLAAYYEWQKKHPKVAVKMNEKVDLWGVAVGLRSFYNSIEKSLKEEKDELLAVFNKQGLKPIDLEFLHRLVEKNTLGKVGVDLGLSDELLPDLALALARIDHKKIRLQQLVNAMHLVEEVLHFSENMPIEKQFAVVEKLALELRHKTPFDFKTTPSRLLRTFLTFQAKTGGILWERQVEKIQDALKNPDESVVTVLPPGMGKTTKINPLLGGILSDGEQTAAFIFPKSIAGDNMPQTHRVLRNALDKVTYALEFHRENLPDDKTLEGLLVLLTNAIKEGEALQFTKEDSLTIRMALYDWLYSYHHEAGTKVTQRQIMLLKEINKIIRHHVSSIPDEAHETYARRLRFNFPLGRDQGISSRRYKAIETCMRLVFEHPVLGEKLRANEVVYLDEQELKKAIEEIVKAIATRKILKIKDPVQLEEIENFLLNRSGLPEWVEKEEKLWEKVCMMRGVLTDLLKTHLKSQALVGYGVSNDPTKGEFTHPSVGNSAVMVDSVDQLPYETLVNTFIYLNTVGLSKNQARDLTRKLLQKVSEEIVRKRCSTEQTDIYQAFKDIIPLEIFNQLVLQTNDSVAVDKIHQAMSDPKKRARFALLYTRFFIWKEIRYWKKSIEGTPQLFSSLFKRELAATGSPYNSDTYPKRLHLRTDLPAQGEVIHIIRSKCPTGVVKTLNAKLPREVLKEILEKYFAKGSTFQSLIDGAPLLTGMENEEVAVEMLKFCEDNRPDIQAVRFFKPHPATGKGALHVMRAGTRKAVLAEEANLPASVCVDYNGQVEGFGANNCPAGDSLATIGPHHTLYRLLQEACRNRGLKREQVLQMLKEQLIKIEQQHIHFVTIEPVKKQIQKMLEIFDQGGDIPLEDLFVYLARNEGLLAEDENYQASREIMKSVLDGAIGDKLIDASSYREVQKIYQDSEDILIKTLEDDPVKLWGMQQKKIDPKTALEAHARQLYRSAQTNSSLTQEEKQRIKNELFAIPQIPYPKEVTVGIDSKGAIQAGAVDLVGVQQTVQVSSRQKVANNNNVEQENQQDIRSQFNQAEMHPRLSASRVTKIMQWPNIDDATSLDWLKFSSPDDISSWGDYFRWKKKELALEFYRVTDLLKSAKNPFLVEAAAAFDPRLWMSNNFLERKGNGTPIEIGSAEQMKLHSVLVHARFKLDGTYDILRMGPLMVHETTEWRERLANVDWWKSDRAVFIWDPISETVQGGCPISAIELRKNQDLALLVNQLRFLDGNTKYRKHESLVTQWFIKNDPDVMENAFRTIHAKRGTHKLGGSHILDVFNKANQVGIEDIIE